MGNRKKAVRRLTVMASALRMCAGPLAVAAGMGAVIAPQAALAQSAVPTPESHFGHRMGADRKLLDYDKLMAYYKALEASSDRIKVVEIGKSAEGKPFVALFISAPENLARLDEYRQMNAKLSDPRGIAQGELDQIVANGKAIIVQSYDLHSSEIGSSLTAVEYTYDMVTRTDPVAMGVMNNVITIVLPSINPDGHQMIYDWYTKSVGTQFEGGPMPWMYQKYVGHDNNRDAFMLNMPESQNLAKILFRDWIPQAYIDHHQMGAYSARISIPPYADPVRPGADPLVWREMIWYGSQMGYDLSAAKLSGAAGDAIYSGWGHFGFHWITPFHNIAGMLTESASLNLATPLYVHPDQLQGGQRNMPDNTPQMNMPDPWTGGWWRARDIVDRQKVASWSLVELASKNRETVLRNAYLKAQRQTQRGLEADVKSYAISIDQHDPLTIGKMVNALLLQKVDVMQAPEAFVADGRYYPAGSYVVPMNQPNQGLVHYLLGETHYPDNTYTRDKEGAPIRPYDMSTDALTEFMGINSDPISTPITAALTPVGGNVIKPGTVASASTWLLDGGLNDSFHAANLLMRAGATVKRVTAASGTAKPGDFIVTGAPSATAQSIASSTGVTFASGDGVSATGPALKAPRIALFNRYRGGNIDEGWTRFLLEQYSYNQKQLMDAEIKAGGLIKKYDVIILPADATYLMTGEAPPPGGRSEYMPDQAMIPPAYRSGFGDEGVKALEDFVKAGGRLITFGEAGDLPIKKFKLPIKNVIAGKTTKEFWSPGSTLKIKVNDADPLAYGMPKDALAIFIMGSQVYEVAPTPKNDQVDIIATYADTNVLRSGWLEGEDLIAGKAAMASVKHGAGEVVLIGFRPQHRAQAHGTFKLLFDSLIKPAG